MQLFCALFHSKQQLSEAQATVFFPINAFEFYSNYL